MNISMKQEDAFHVHINKAVNGWVRAKKVMQCFVLVVNYTLGSSAASYIFHNQNKTFNNLYLAYDLPISCFFSQSDVKKTHTPCGIFFIAHTFI